jgi:hypothetical protein
VGQGSLAKIKSRLLLMNLRLSVGDGGVIEDIFAALRPLE